MEIQVIFFHLLSPLSKYLLNKVWNGQKRQFEICMNRKEKNIGRNVGLRLLIFVFFVRKDYCLIKGDSFIQFRGISKINLEKKNRNVWAYFVHLNRLGWKYMSLILLPLMKLSEYLCLLSFTNFPGIRVHFVLHIF